MQVEEREPGFRRKDGAADHLVVVLPRAREAVRDRVGEDPRARVARHSLARLRHHGAGRLAERDHEDRDEDDDERRASHEGGLMSGYRSILSQPPRMDPEE